MNVVTTYWTGEECPYDERYVRALASQLPVKLTVLTNAEIDYPHTRPLIEPDRYPGWLSKLEHFRPENRDLRPALHIDLDTFIMGDITPLLELDPTQLWMIRQFYQTPGKAETGLFVIPDAELSDTIWNSVAMNPVDRKAADAALLRGFPHQYIPDEVDGIVSYKVHQYEATPPSSNVRVICFHGLPKPHETEGWAREFFDTHAGP